MAYPEQLRIIGGTHKRRLLRLPPAAQAPAGFRPTPDRVRETLFNWLGQDLTGLRCLDLFAGSGALAFEAASRNASHVLALEQSRPVLRALQQNQQQLDLPRLQIVAGDAYAWLAQAAARGEAPYDVVFLDPPFDQADWPRLTTALAPLLAPQARVYCEYDRPLTALPGLERLKHARAGMVHYHLFTPQPGAHPAPPT